MTIPPELRQIAAARNFYLNVLDDAPALIWRTGPDGRYDWFNSSWLMFTGRSPAQALGDGWLTDIHPDDRERYVEAYRAAFKAQQPFELEYRLRRYDGEYRWVLVIGKPFTQLDGLFAGYIGYSFDITQRKLAELALDAERARLAERVAERTCELSIANAELERAARLKDEFLASISHELRTPLNAIINLAGILEEGAAGPLMGRQHHYVQTILENGQHLLALINTILDLSKIEAGHMFLEIGPVPIEAVCRNSMYAVQALARKKRLSTTITIAEDLTTVRADERCLRQVLINLLDNAVKFTPEAGAIGVEVSHDKVAHTILFTVWDSGIGIAKEDQARLFQPFVQLDSSLTRHYNGAGLGLALVARMVRLLGGSVRVESTLGQGSRFMVSLPMG